MQELRWRIQLLEMFFIAEKKAENLPSYKLIRLIKIFELFVDFMRYFKIDDDDQW